MLDVRQGDEVLGTQLAGDTQAAVARKRHVENTGHVVQRLALADDLLLGIDDRDLGFRRGPVKADVGVDMGAVERVAVGRRCQIAGASSGSEPPGFDAAGQVDYRDIVADAIGGVDCGSGMVREHRVGFEAGLERASHLEGIGIDY